MKEKISLHDLVDQLIAATGLSKKQAEIRNLSSGHELGYIINAQKKING